MVPSTPTPSFEGGKMGRGRKLYEAAIARLGASPAQDVELLPTCGREVDKGGSTGAREKDRKVVDTWLREHHIPNQRKPRVVKTKVPKKGAMLPEEKALKKEREWCPEVVSDPFYGRGRHAVDPYIFPEDGSVNVVHEGVLSHMITLYTVPFHEMTEFVVPSGIPANQPLTALKNNIKTQDRKTGIQRKYTAQEALEYKEKAIVCEICNIKFKEDSEKHGDHDHKTGEWRGTLCGNCNSAIGMLKDSPENCLHAAAYLRKSRV